VLFPLSSLTAGELLAGKRAAPPPLFLSRPGASCKKKQKSQGSKCKKYMNLRKEISELRKYIKILRKIVKMQTQLI
jgi:hypothetical protein